MASPQSTPSDWALWALATAAASPAMSEWLYIGLGAVAGAVLAITEQDTPRQLHALVLGVRGALMALLFAGLASALVRPYITAAAHLVLLAMAGSIAWRQERLLADAGRVWAAIKALKGTA